MKWNHYLIISVFINFLVISHTNASISGKSLYLIIDKGLQAAQTITVDPTYLETLKHVHLTLEPMQKSSASVPTETETEARRVLSGLAKTYGDAYTAAFFSAFSLPPVEQVKQQAYPRTDRVKMVAEFIATQRTDEKFDAAYHNKLFEAAQKKIGRPGNGETVTLYINKRKVTGQIHYHENTFDIGIVTFPNDDLPAEFNAELIKARQEEFMTRYFKDRRDAYLKKATFKIQAAAMAAGNYLVLSGEWYSPTEAYPALSYFLRPPEADGRITLPDITPVPVIERINAGQNPTTYALSASLIGMMIPRSDDGNKKTITPETYTRLLTYWSASLVAKNNPVLSKGLPLSDAPGEALHKAATQILCALLMEP